MSRMLNENIKPIRNARGLSQEELAIRLHVVRQTISKWERGLSVPDSDMLIAIAEVLETPVSTLLGETVDEEKETAIDDMKELAEKLEAINLQLAQRKARRRSVLRWLLILVCATIGIIFAVLAACQSPYLNWHYGDPETAVVGVAFHGFEWVFVRVAPVLLAGAIAGLFLMRKKG